MNLIKKIFIVSFLLICGISSYAAYEQVYKVTPDTITWKYDWVWVGKIGVSAGTDTINTYVAFMEHNGNMYANHLGLGTTAPVYPIDIIGSTTTAYHLAIGTSTAYQVVITTNGFIGVGTLAPTSTMTIAGNLGAEAGTFSGLLEIGSLDINGTTVIEGIIDDDTFATAQSTNVPTAESVKSYVDSSVSVATTSMLGTENTWTATQTFDAGIASSTGVFSGGIEASTLDTGHGANELYGMNQDVLTTSSPTFSSMTILNGISADTLDTGQGANELYEMDQNLKTTDSPTFSNQTLTYGLSASTANITTELQTSSVTINAGEAIKFAVFVDTMSIPSAGGILGFSADYGLYKSTPGGAGAWIHIAGGGLDAITSDATLTGDGTGVDPLGINLGNANTWTETQTFSKGIYASTAVIDDSLLTSSVTVNAAEAITFSVFVDTTSAPSSGGIVGMNTDYDLYKSTPGGAGAWELIGGESAVTTNATLTGDGTALSPLGINLSNGNTWGASQNFNTGVTYFGASGTSNNGNYIFGTSNSLIGHSSYASYGALMGRNANFTKDTMCLVTGIESNSIEMFERADYLTDFSKVTFANPTFRIHSADNTDLNDWISFYHDQTNAVVDGGTGGVKIATHTVIQGRVNFGADAEGTDTYVISIPGITVYVTGLTVTFTANTANTGACTLNINALGAISLKSLHDQDPADNYIESGSVVMAVYDGTNFQMIQPDANP